jgi:hypothetical protein
MHRFSVKATLVFSLFALLIGGCAKDNFSVNLDTTSPFFKGVLGFTNISVTQTVDPLRIITIRTNKKISQDTTNIFYGCAYTNINDTGNVFTRLYRIDFPPITVRGVSATDLQFYNIFNFGFYSPYKSPNGPEGVRLFIRQPGDTSTWVSHNVVQPADSYFEVLDLIQYREEGTNRAAIKAYIRLKCLTQRANGDQRTFTGETIAIIIKS